MSSNIKPILLGTYEVAEMLWVSQQYIDQLIREDKIPHKKISWTNVFFEEDIIEFMKKREEKAKTDTRIKLKK